MRVLVVDDNVDGADMLAAALTARGYDARVAHDAPTALRIAAEFQPKVGFLDLGLPVMDGYELAARLRERAGPDGITLVAVTGYGQPSDRQKTRNAGFRHHLVKPVDFGAIEALLAEAGCDGGDNGLFRCPGYRPDLLGPNLRRVAPVLLPTSGGVFHATLFLGSLRLITAAT